MAKRGGYPGMGGMNMNNMMKQVQKMQKQMEENQKQMVESQKELEEKEFSATAGGGAVEVTVSGKKLVTKVTLDPDAVDPDDVEMLEDLIMVAVNDAMKKVDDANSASMAKMTGGMGGFPF
jgi:DNA-binding YbaB/EbfC family protein